MRLLLEILIIGGLIYLGWEIPFKQRVDQLNGKTVGRRHVSAGRCHADIRCGNAFTRPAIEAAFEDYADPIGSLDVGLKSSLSS